MIFKNRPFAFCCAVFLSSYALAQYLPKGIKLILIVLSAALVLLLLCFLRGFKRAAILSALCLSITLGTAYGLYYFDVACSDSMLYISEEYSVEFEITDITYQSDSIAYIDAEILSCNGDPADFNCHFTLYSPKDVIKIGDVFRADTVFEEIENTDSFDAQAYYRSKGIFVSAECYDYELIRHNTHIFGDAVRSIRSYCTEVFGTYTDPDTAGLLSALSVGDKGNIDDSIRRDFTRTGISHMLAISGMHLSIVMGCIMMFAQLFGVNRKISSAIVAIICFCFIFIAGGSSSVMRAGIMFMIMSLSGLFNRRNDSLTTLFFAVFIIVSVYPESVYDIGLILSFTATLGIIITVGPIMKRIKDRDVGRLSKLSGGICISVLTTLSALSFTLIPSLKFFDSISLMSVLSNIAITPFVTVILFTIPLFIAFSPIPSVAAGIGYMLNIVTKICVWLVGMISSVPGVAVSLEYPFMIYTFIALAVGVILMLVIRKPLANILPYVCWLVSFAVLLGGFQLGYGSSADFLFYSESGSDAVIVRNKKVSIYLDLGRGSVSAEKRAFGMSSDEMYLCDLDHWIISHYSDDIIRSLDRMSDTEYIRNIYIPNPENDTEKVIAQEISYYTEHEDIKLHYYGYGDDLDIDSVSFVIHDPVTFEDSEVVIPSAVISYGERTVTYYGRGYFDFHDAEESYDILFLGECGTKRKQTMSPEIKCNILITASVNETAVLEISGQIYGLSDKTTYRKLRIG